MERRSDRIVRWFLPTLGGLLVVLAYAFPPLLRGPSLFAADGDPGRHIRVGTHILQTLAIPNVDLFSHTMGGQPFIPYEWLSEVIFAAAHMLAGLAGVALLTAILFASAVGLVQLTMRRAGIPSVWAFLFAFLSMILQAVHLHPRPHMFTTFLVAAFAFLLLEARRDRRTSRLLLLPLLMVFWANVHGGFLVGFILLFMFAADAWVASWTSHEAQDAGYAKRVTGIVGLCLVASFLTPAGLELWPHTTGYLGEKWLVDFTQEYTSPDFHDPLMKLFLAVLMGGVGLLALLPARVDAFGVATWILFAAFALHSGRNIPLFGVLALPWMARWLVAVLERPEVARRRLAARFAGWTDRVMRTESLLPGWPVAALGMVAITMVVLQPVRRDNYEFSSEVFPTAAVEYLRDSGFEPPGPIYNEFGWGGYLLYAWPEIPVFIDGQTDFYGEELTREYVRIRHLEPDWSSLLDKHGVKWALIPPDVALNQALELTTEWHSIYSDSTAVAWVRGTP